MAVAVVAGVILGVVALLVWGSWSSDDGSAVDDLPSVSEVVAAQAHRHGVDLPELSDADRARLSAPPTAASSLSAYDQVLNQLVVVRDSTGIDEAIVILGEVAIQSDVVASDCSRLYDALTESTPSTVPVGEVCPG
jgi:hypothetical protein